MSFRTDRREREKSKNYIFGFLNRRRAPHVEMTMGGVNQVSQKVQSCGSGRTVQLLMAIAGNSYFSNTTSPFLIVFKT